MLETIDPDTMIRHSSITTEDRANPNASTSSIGSSIDQHKTNVFERKITAYLSEDNGGYETPASVSMTQKTGGTGSETDQEG